MKKNSENTKTAFGIIAKSGEAKAYIFEALELSKNNKFEEASKLIERANDLLIEAHKIQFSLIASEANEINVIELNLLIVHAQDHLMTTLLAKDIIIEMIESKKDLLKLLEV